MSKDGLSYVVLSMWSCKDGGWESRWKVMLGKARELCHVRTGLPRSDQFLGTINITRVKKIFPGHRKIRWASFLIICNSATAKVSKHSFIQSIWPKDLLAIFRGFANFLGSSSINSSSCDSAFSPSLSFTESATWDLPAIFPPWK